MFLLWTNWVLRQFVILYLNCLRHVNHIPMFYVTVLPNSFLNQQKRVLLILKIALNSVYWSLFYYKTPWDTFYCISPCIIDPFCEFNFASGIGVSWTRERWHVIIFQWILSKIVGVSYTQLSLTYKDLFTMVSCKQVIKEWHQTARYLFDHRASVMTGRRWRLGNCWRLPPQFWSISHFPDRWRRPLWSSRFVGSPMRQRICYLIMGVP